MRPTVAFDLDGTLVDTAPDLLRALDFALEREGLNPPEDHEARNFIGAGARAMIERALAYSRVQFNKEKVDGMFRQFLLYYEDHIADYSRAFPGVEHALTQLHAEGALLAVCTNKHAKYAEKLLRALKLADHFAFIAGGDSFPFRKPDPRHLTETIALAGGDPRRALMVGDSQTDIDTAKAAGIPVVAVDFGYTDRHVREFGPSRIVSHFDELTVAMCEDLMQAARA
jgi:phosphoglycolate phosphatase